ncbi:MAG: indole-3-glycerol phosphate synthase TrpC [Bacteroidetes bacterium]|nr:indole-3-glycerol phosphate synthase TrpC [Bacteroidota bacterium]
MNILDTIVEHKRIEVLMRKQKRPLSDLQTFPHYRRKVNPIVLPDSGRAGIIAEFKRRSPSKGALNMEADPGEVAAGYQAAGVSVMSVLTDRKFFGGSFRDLSTVREACPELPLLRKDFIIDPYQVHEASAYGADMILLIAAILEKQEVADLAGEAVALGMHVLLEVHDADELEKHVPSIRFVGVNNRDLKTFRVDTGRSLDLIGRMPPGVVAVSESGISTHEELTKLWEAGFRLFLMGERFMKQSDPGEACRDFIENL